MRNYIQLHEREYTKDLYILYIWSPGETYSPSVPQLDFKIHEVTSREIGFHEVPNFLKASFELVYSRVFVAKIETNYLLHDASSLATHIDEGILDTLQSQIAPFQYQLVDHKHLMLEI